MYSVQDGQAQADSGEIPDSTRKLGKFSMTLKMTDLLATTGKLEQAEYVAVGIMKMPS